MTYSRSQSLYRRKKNLSLAPSDFHDHYHKYPYTGTFTVFMEKPGLLHLNVVLK